jgi:hypothetical protein
MDRRPQLVMRKRSENGFSPRDGAEAVFVFARRQTAAGYSASWVWHQLGHCTREPTN